MTSLSLCGKAFLVTGPAKGMGPAIVRAIAALGGDLALVGRDLAAMEPLAAEIADMGRLVVVQRADVTDEAGVAAAVVAAGAAFGTRLYGAVNVAGVTGPSGKKLWEHTVEDYNDVFGVNVLGTFLVMKAMMPRLMAQGEGAIVNIGGTFGFKGVRDFSLYGATKWTLRGLTKSAALEAAAGGVRVNCVSPGGVEGPRLMRQLGEDAERLGMSLEERLARFSATTALGRMSTAEDIANAVVFLLSPMARNITGQDILVDGGSIV